MSARRQRGQRFAQASLLATLLACLCLAPPPASPGDAVAHAHAASIAARDREMIEARLQAMAPSRPAQADLFALALAGDGEEDAFRNEALYFGPLATARYGAADRTLALVNHPASLAASPMPLATPANLRLALEGLGRRMDPDDLLLLFITTHGSPEHELTLWMEGHVDAALHPEALRGMLDAAGIGNRLLIVSACYSGGFIPALAGPDTLVITAARRDRPSFGCGNSGSATWFGHALLVEGLNRDGGLVEAFEYAKRQVARREAMEGLDPSLPQISIGADIGARLRAWEAGLERAPALAYPHPL